MENYEDIPMIQQPKNLKIQLFPHQLSLVYMMEELEIGHGITGETHKVITDIGVNADMTGYGKTLSMVTLILRDKMEWDLNTEHIEETIQTYSSQHIKKYTNNMYPKNNTTFILASPSIIHQWIKEFSYTNLKVGEVTNRKVAINIDVNEYDVVIVSPGLYNILTERYYGIAWKRFIYDEPTTVFVPSMHDIIAGFTWFLTATPSAIASKHKSRRMSYMNKIVNDNHFNSIIDIITIKNKDDFVKLSFQMPTTHHKEYLCYTPAYRAVNGIVSDRISKMIEAGNIYGAIEALGGQQTDNIIELVKKNKQIELEEIKSKIHIWTLRDDMNKIEEWKEKEKIILQQLEDLNKRFEKILEENCSICFNTLNKPVMEPCCQNIFCGSCLFTWLNSKGSCPLCRKIIQTDKLIYIHKNDEFKSETKEETKINKTKEETIVKIIQNNKKGRFLIFSDWDESFNTIREVLKTNNIPFVEIKGQINTRTKNIEKFREGEISVVFLNSINNSSGINMQETTDIILYHYMNDSTTTQIIGRANRIGRKTPLNVHHLIAV